MLSLTANVEALLDAVPDALVGVDRAGVIAFVNSATESLFGYERDDLVGAPLEVLVPESVRPIHRVHRERYTGEPRIRPMGTDLKLNGRRRDGTQFPVDIALSPMKTEDGAMLVVAAVRDMTRYRSAQAARRRRDLLSAVVQVSAEAIFNSTPEGIITSWNPAAEQMYGYGSKEIIGRSVELLSPRDRTGEMTANLVRIRAREHLDPYESMGVRKDGMVFAATLTLTAIHDIDGTVIGASTMVQDPTRAQHAFDAARSMIEASLDSLVAISPEGKITDANEATARATGVPRDKLIGTCFSDYFTAPAKAEEIYQRVFAEGMARDYPLTLRHRDGTLTEVLYNAAVYRDRDARVLGVCAAARDVTKQMQARREIAEQLAQEQARLAELERFQRMTIDRALKVIELKKEIATLRGSDVVQQGESDDEW